MKPRSCKVTLVREEWRVPREYEFGDTVVVPLWAGHKMRWRMADGELQTQKSCFNKSQSQLTRHAVALDRGECTPRARSGPAAPPPRRARGPSAPPGSRTGRQPRPRPQQRGVVASLFRFHLSEAGASLASWRHARPPAQPTAPRGRGSERSAMGYAPPVADVAAWARASGGSYDLRFEDNWLQVRVRQPLSLGRHRVRCTPRVKLKLHTHNIYRVYHRVATSKVKSKSLWRSGGRPQSMAHWALRARDPLFHAETGC